MQTKTIITIFITSIVFVGLIIWGTAPKSNSAASVQGASDVNGGTSALTATETVYDFGTISMANGTTNKIFKITNSSDKDVKLVNIETSCMCTTAYIVNAGREKGPYGMPGHGGAITRTNEIIKAGESRDIKVVYDPNAHGPSGVGAIDRYLFLTDEFGGRLQFEIKAVVTP